MPVIRLVAILPAAGQREGVIVGSSPFPAPDVRLRTPVAGKLVNLVVESFETADATNIELMIDGLPTGLSVSFAALETGIKVALAEVLIPVATAVSFRFTFNNAGTYRMNASTSFQVS